LKISHAAKVFGPGVVALDRVDLEVQRGEFVVILGSSGSGKSTLLRSIIGLERLTSGQIAVADAVVSPRNLRAIRCNVGMIFQHFNLVRNLNVTTNVLCGCLGRMTPLETALSWLYLFKRSRIEAAERILDLVGLSEKRWHRADSLSGGQQQRVGIARALMQEPQILLADEPVASLDPITGRMIMDLLHAISRQRGLTVLVNLHQVDLAQAYADRIVGLNRGVKVFDDAREHLTETALNEIYASVPRESPSHAAVDAVVHVPARFHATPQPGVSST
jgi:phosphonate transport system ATP-binding protein